MAENPFGYNLRSSGVDHVRCIPWFSTSQNLHSSPHHHHRHQWNQQGGVGRGHHEGGNEAGSSGSADNTERYNGSHTYGLHHHRALFCDWIIVGCESG
ncbi:hypothetical protein SUGI_0497400 [Cryptomeria japonica]|nr:hypothetical protein SUGI_0497400 [Cryptomeria japonica]